MALSWSCRDEDPVDYAAWTENQGAQAPEGDGKVFDWHSVCFCQIPYSSTVTDRVTGQMAQYMHDLKVKYGFLTTYDETIFLRQVLINGRWTLEYSPVIQHSVL